MYFSWDTKEISGDEVSNKEDIQIIIDLHCNNGLTSFLLLFSRKYAT